MNTPLVIRSVVVGAALQCIGFGAATIASVSRARSLEAQLGETQAVLDKLKGARAGRLTAGYSDEALLKLLEDKEAAYAKLSDDYAQLKQQHEARPSRTANNPQRGGPGSAAQSSSATATNSWLDRVREQDPERYKQIVAQREERRKAADQWLKDQLTQLDHRAQSAPTQEESEIASQVADTLAKLNDLRSQWASTRDLPEDQRQAATQQLQADMRTTFQTLSDLRDRDRKIQFATLFQSLGVTDQNTVQSSVDGINNILDSTRYMPPRGTGGGPGGGPGWGGGRQGGGDGQQQQQQPAQQTSSSQ